MNKINAKGIWIETVEICREDSIQLTPVVYCIEWDIHGIIYNSIITLYGDDSPLQHRLQVDLEQSLFRSYYVSLVGE